MIKTVIATTLMGLALVACQQQQGQQTDPQPVVLPTKK